MYMLLLWRINPFNIVSARKRIDSIVQNGYEIQYCTSLFLFTKKTKEASHYTISLHKKTGLRQENTRCFGTFDLKKQPTTPECPSSFVTISDFMSEDFNKLLKQRKNREETSFWLFLLIAIYFGIMILLHHNMQISIVLYFFGLLFSILNVLRSIHLLNQIREQARGTLTNR